MKRVTIAALAVLLVGALAFATGQEEQKISMKLGHIRDMEHPTHKAALKFAELVSEYSGGRIEVKVYPNSQLGTPAEMFSQLQSGDLAMVYGGINTIAWIGGGEPYEITSMPFLYRDYDHMRRALNADFFQPVQKQVEAATGIKIVNMAGDTAPRGLSANRAVYSVNDLKGLKIRTATSETALRLWKHFGALPQQIAYADLYMALKTGVVEAQENGALVVASSKFYEVQKYYIRTDYIRDIETFYMSMALWNKLSEADRKLILKASEEAGAYETELTLKMIQDSYKTLREKLTVIEPPQLDIQSFRDSVVGLFDDWEGKKWPVGLLEKIRNLK
jgi:tripartite ATP-independent transporter DctP family solute receptor